MDKLSQIRSDRRTVYGDPKENHQGIASMWAPLLQRWWLEIKKGQSLPPHVVALLMAALKLDRMRLVFHEDNYDDIANYLLFAKEWQKDHHDGEVQPERIYVSGPFSAGTEQLIEANIQAASDSGLAIMKKGHLAHVPHAATCRWHNQLDYEDFMRLDFSLLETWATGLLYLAPSPGADRELARAKELNLKIYHSVAEIQPRADLYIEQAIQRGLREISPLWRKIFAHENLTDPVGFSWYVPGTGPGDKDAFSSERPISPQGETTFSVETQPAGDGMGAVDRASWETGPHCEDCDSDRCDSIEARVAEAHRRATRAVMDCYKPETSPSEVFPSCECTGCAPLTDKDLALKSAVSSIARFVAEAGETLTVEKNREMSMTEADKRFRDHQPQNVGDLT